MPEMATLDAFFNKIERSVIVSTAEQQKCKSSDNNVENHKDMSRKRGRDDTSAQSRKLQRKRKKPLDSNLNVSKCPVEVDVALDVVDNCKTCNKVEVQEENMSFFPSSAIEISYEDFLRATGIAHVETSLGSSEDACDVQTEVEVTPVEASSKDGELTSESLVKSLKKSEQSHDEDEREDEIPEVASKDIRSFFGKAEKVVQPVSTATLMKVKADVHCQQSEKRNAPSEFADGHLKAGSELARRQRAAIVITDDDLDIEVIHVSDNEDDSEIDLLDDLAVDDVIPESCTESHIPDAKRSSVCREAFVNADDCKKSAVEHNSLTVVNINTLKKHADSGKELKLIIHKIEDTGYKAKLPSPEETASDSEEINCDQDAVQHPKEECSDESDEVIMVEEADNKAGSGEFSANEPGASEFPNSQRVVPCATKPRKPVQVREFVLYELV